MKKKGLFIAIALIITLCGCSKSGLQLLDSDAQSEKVVSYDTPSETVVEFAEPIIEQAVRKLLQKPDGNITSSELLKITVLGDEEGTNGTFGDIKGDITTLSDLKWMKNLKILSLGDCKIYSLSGIEELKNLEILRLRRNKISNIEPLCDLVKLKELDLSENLIYDTSALCNLTNMENLGLSDCWKVDLSGISGMSKLKELNISDNNITEISILKENTDLEILYLARNNIHDISSLKELKKLTFLNLSKNNISDISPLKGIKKLTFLDLSQNNIIDIEILDGLPNLERIDVDNNPIPEEKVKAIYSPKEQDYFTRKFKQQLGDTEYIFELLAYKDKKCERFQTAKITIKNANSKTIIQEIIPSDYTSSNMNPNYFNDDLGFIIEDMNFDGYADIRIVEILPASPNIPYICWTWNKDIEQYVYHKELSEITSFDMDYENEIIYNFGRSSASEHFEEYYRYIDGVLTRVKEVRSGYLDDSDPEQGYAITHELIDKEWVMTEKKKIRIGG